MLHDDEKFLSYPLCNVTSASPGQLKEHMQRTHIPKETMYRAMLDHMMFAHEMDDGSVNTDVNATDTNYGKEQRDESVSNSINDGNEEEMQGINEHDSSYDATANMTMFDNGSDDTNTTANMDVLFDTSDENIVVVEAVECKPAFSSTAANDKITDIMMSCEYDGGDERDEDEYVADKETIDEVEEITELPSVKIIKSILAPQSSAAPEEDTKTVSYTEIKVFECNECWYYSAKKRDLRAHKQLHVKRGALFNCTKCVFNVTKSAILYHHYRYGHMIDEPEIRYPENSIVRAGQRDMIAKNANDKLVNKTSIVKNIYEYTGPFIVWHYRKENSPPFSKVFKCRYCPYTNRKRYNTVEHERMHLDHPENHKKIQHRLSGGSVPPSPLNPCKRCTYVCNNAGVLASHVKVHSTSYRCSTVGFYDISITDRIQIRALEYVMELEQSLLLDKNTATNSGISHSANEMLSDSSSDNESQEDVTKYIENDNPELKFCPYCPARYFFRSDLRFHIRFHRFRGWKNVCKCCSFVSRSESHVAAHELVHCDEYAQRTTELLASGYPVNSKYPRSSEYAGSVSDNFVDNDKGLAIETPLTTCKNFEKSSNNIITVDDVVTDNMISCKYDAGKEQFEDNQVGDEVIVVRAEEVPEPTSVKIMKRSSLSSLQLANYKNSKIRMPEPDNQHQRWIKHVQFFEPKNEISAPQTTYNVNVANEAIGKSQKLSCRFCTYRTNCEVDLAKHIPVHFLRSIDELMSTNVEYATDKTSVFPTPTDVGVGDHTEFHGKQGMCSNHQGNNNIDDQDDVPDDLDKEDS